MHSASEWRQFYADERARLGAAHIHRLLDQAAMIAGGVDGLVVPHTRLDATGGQLATAVNTVVAGGADRVLALGVLHGARRRDHQTVTAARSGEASAVEALRGVHDEAGLASEEFSLDAFSEMLAVAGERAGRRIEIVRRYPFLVGDDPTTLPGLDELTELVEAGAAVVATTDPIHHGHGYGDDAEHCCAAGDSATLELAGAAIGAQFELLGEHRFGEFQAMTTRHRSDFRDTGPVLALLLGRSFTWTMHNMALVDYSDVLRSPAPTWVAGALVALERACR